MKLIKLFSFLFLPLLLSFSKVEGKRLAESKKAFNNFLKKETRLQKIPALSVLIFKNNQIFYELYLGKSHIENNIALEKDHLFLLASVSKIVTATALLQLYEEGLFSLDDPINNHLPFKVSIPNHAKPITFRMLLTHTSAIADGPALNDQYYYMEDSPVVLSDFLRSYLVEGGKLYDPYNNFYDFEPGTEHEYTNIGSALIALLVENISKQNFNTYCRKRIFKPLRMKNSFWRLDEIFAANRTIVQPYRLLYGRYKAVEHYTFTDYPNGGLRSTARDLFLLLRSFTSNKKNHQLLKPKTIQQMITPQIPLIAEEEGLHLSLIDRETGLWGHSGGEEGVSTLVAFSRKKKIGIIILANREDLDLDFILYKAYLFTQSFR